MINLNAWFQKHDLCAENILYIYRKDRKTVIQRTDGAEFALFVPVHSILSTLPEKNFLSISKGIVVCRSHIVNISNDGVYTMSDGRTFQVQSHAPVTYVLSIQFHDFFKVRNVASSANLPHSGKAWFCCETSTVMKLVFLPFIYSWWASTC